MRPERVIDPTTNMLALGIPALAVLTLGLSRTGGSLAFLGVLASIAHVLAVSVWFGGAVLLARVVLAGPGEEDLVHAVHGFGRISNPAIVVTVISGLVQLYRQDGGELFSTSHGRVLLLKTVAVAAMIFVGLTARQVARARLARASELNVRVADRMRRAFGTEAAIGLVVLMLTGWMMNYTPGKVPSNGGGGRYAVVEPIIDQTSGLELEVMLRPGRVGTNDLRVEVTSPETGLSELTLRFIPPDGGAYEIIQPIAELTGAGAAVSSGGLPFDVAGTWTVEVNATTSTGAAQNIRSEFLILNADGSTPEGSPLPTVPAVTTSLPDGPRLTEPPASTPESNSG